MTKLKSALQNNQIMLRGNRKNPPYPMMFIVHWEGQDIVPFYSVEKTKFFLRKLAKHFIELNQIDLPFHPLKEAQKIATEMSKEKGNAS